MFTYFGVTYIFELFEELLMNCGTPLFPPLPQIVGATSHHIQVQHSRKPAQAGRMTVIVVQIVPVGFPLLACSHPTDKPHWVNVLECALVVDGDRLETSALLV